MSAQTHRVVIVDDHPAVREGLRAMVRAAGDEYTVVAEFSTYDDALEKIRILKPSLVLADLRVPGLSVHGFMRKVGSMDIAVAVLVVSASTNRDDIKSALQGGAMGYVSKAVELPELRDALAAVARGEMWASADIIDCLFNG